MNREYIDQFGETLVPLEYTVYSEQSSSSSSSSSSPSPTFHHFHAPLSLFLDYIDASVPTQSKLQTNPQSPSSLYLAQCSTSSLPTALNSDIPTPPILTTLGKGDLYDTNIWLGLPPTYTPLHRDPNPNLFLQIVGEKTVRLMEPGVGRGVFERVRGVVEGEKRADGGIGNGGVSANFRGEEMMMGRERAVLEGVVWGDEGEAIEKYGVEIEGEVIEVKLGAGDALFIPLGWWHSIKGVGKGITGSVNWWFR